MATKTVVIYSTPTCVFCNHAKAFFNEHGVKYTEYNVATDLKRRNEMVEKSGQMGVPVIFIGDELVVGYDEHRLSELLNIK